MATVGFIGIIVFIFWVLARETGPPQPTARSLDDLSPEMRCLVQSAMRGQKGGTLWQDPSRKKSKSPKHTSNQFSRSDSHSDLFSPPPYGLFDPINELAVVPPYDDDDDSLNSSWMED